MDYLQKELELVFKEVGVCLQQLHPRNSWLWAMLSAVPCTLHSRDNSPGKGARPDSYNPINTTSKGHPDLFLKGELKT